jgi:hypothetical protein
MQMNTSARPFGFVWVDLWTCGQWPVSLDRAAPNAAAAHFANAINM